MSSRERKRHNSEESMVPPCSGNGAGTGEWWQSRGMGGPNVTSSGGKWVGRSKKDERIFDAACSGLRLSSSFLSAPFGEDEESDLEK